MALHPSPRRPRVEPDSERAVTPLPARRILIIGNGGAGKSTLAAALGAYTDLPVIHLDRLYWRAGWEQTPRSEWVETLQQLMAPDAWILDGNYRGTLTERVERAAALVLLDPLTPVCLWRIVRRRLVARQTADLAEGCDERLDIEFVRYVAGYRRTHRLDAHAACATAARTGKRVLHIRGRVDPKQIAISLGHNGRVVRAQARCD